MEKVKECFEIAYNSCDDNDFAIENYLKCIELLKKHFNPQDKDSDKMQEIAFNIQSVYNNMLNHVKDEKQKLAYYDEMIQLMPLEGWYEKGFYYLCQLQNDEAIGCFDECLRYLTDDADSSNYSMYFRLIDSYTELAQFEKSFLVIEKLTKTMPYEVKCKKAEILIKQMKFEDAIPLLEDVLNSEIASFYITKEFVRTLLIQCHKGLQNIEKVLFYMEQNKNTYGDNCLFLFEKGSYLLSVKKYDKALECFLDAKNIMKSSSDTLCNIKELKKNIAECYTALGQEDKAKLYALKSPKNFDIDIYTKQKLEELQKMIPQSFSDDDKNNINSIVQKYISMADMGLRNLEIDDEEITLGCDLITKWVFNALVKMILSNLDESKREELLSGLAFRIYEIFSQGLEKNIEQSKLISLVKEDAEKYLEKAL